MRKALLMVALAHTVSVHATCSLRPLEPKGSEIHFRSVKIDLGEADDSAHPTAWQGPLVAGDCKIDMSIIERPLMASDTGRYLYVSTYSGSMRNLTLVDLKSCSTAWKSEAFSGALKITSKHLIVDKKRIELDGACVPKTSQR